MESFIDFKKIIQEAEFKFIPVIDLKNNLIYGYKIIKDFKKSGYKNNDYVYEKAFQEGLFEFFVLKLQEKSYKMAVKKGLTKFKMFYTLRINFVTDFDFFFSSVNNLTSNFEIKLENLIFEIKGVEDWVKISKVLNWLDEETIFLFKETKENALNLKIVEYLSPNFLEVSSFDSIRKIKENQNIESKIIFKVKDESENKNLEMLRNNIDLIYKY